MTAGASIPGRTRRYGEGREALLAAAVHVVATRGLRHLTYRAVAQEAGVAHGLVAHHFGTRDALLEAALEYSLDNSVASISTRPGSGDVDALFAGLDQLLEDFSDDQVFGFELILESRRRPELRPHVERMYGAYRAALRQELECAGIDCDASLVHLVFAAVDGMVFQELTLGHPERTQAGLRHLRRLLGSLIPRSGERDEEAGRAPSPGRTTRSA